MRVAVVAGDTKVVRRAKARLYLSVAGIGVKRAQAPLDIHHRTGRRRAGIRSGGDTASR